MKTDFIEKLICEKVDNVSDNFLFAAKIIKKSKNTDAKVAAVKIAVRSILQPCAEIKELIDAWENN